MNTRLHLASNPGPKSLRKKSVASSNLHDHLQDEDKAYHHDQAESSFNTNMIQAFKKLRLSTKFGSCNDAAPFDLGGTTFCQAVRTKETSAEVGIEASKVPSTPTFLIHNDSNEYNILQDSKDEDLSILQEESEDNDHQSPPQRSKMQLIPLRQGQGQGLKRSSNQSTNTSLASLDSGVGSERSSKRPSIEQSSPDPLNSSYSLSSRKRISRSERISLDEKECERELLSESFEEVFVSSRRPSRVNVDEEAFSELVKAAIRLVSDVRPGSELPDEAQETCLKNSLKDLKRRKSLLDISTSNIQNKKSPRKISAQPILQSSQRFSTTIRPAEVSARSRRTSACIICERKKRTSEDFESCVIKTPMIRNMQERRRFSEVLRVYKPGDLPFMELVVPKICELKTPTASPKVTAEELRSLVDQNMPTFVRLTNWNCLYAHLVSKQLLDPHMREYMIGTATQQQKGNKFYGEYLLSHDSHGYQRLLECLREEVEHPGHITLANLLENGPRYSI